MKLLTRRDALHGCLIYAAGDSAATLLSGEFRWPRLLGMALLGGSLYAMEIPAYFRWIDQRCAASGKYGALQRMLLAMAFFNPLWIARHLVFIKIFSGQWHTLAWSLLDIAASSFWHVLPVALPVNYFIQNVLPLHLRFLANALFSALMAVYFALSEVLFG